MLPPLTKSPISPEELEKLRRKIRERVDENRREETDSTFTPPHYDEVYWNGIAKLDENDSY